MAFNWLRTHADLSILLFFLIEVSNFNSIALCFGALPGYVVHVITFLDITAYLRV